MKCIATALLLLAAAGSSHAYAGSTEGRVLSIQKFDVTKGVSVELPTVLKPDGTICVSYVSAVTQTLYAKGDNSVDVSTSDICGKPRTAGSQFPENLKSLSTITSDGISMQLVQLASNNN